MKKMGITTAVITGAVLALSGPVLGGARILRVDARMARLAARVRTVRALARIAKGVYLAAHRLGRGTARGVTQMSYRPGAVHVHPDDAG